MKAAWLSAVVLAVSVSFMLTAAEEQTSADVQDVLLLADAGPVLIRLHVRVDDKPSAAAWTAYLDRLFSDLDRDGDGSLSKEESARPRSLPSSEASSTATSTRKRPPRRSPSSAWTPITTAGSAAASSTPTIA